ncbi:MAG TPA: spore germination protein GerW family protein [Dehalococcoidia bacterium]|nr:spore germination protein GerW family protein [Dehalococcoidia bacterium]
MQDVDFSGNTLVSQIAERLKTSARVEVVYGEERKIGDKTIIPIAVVAYAFGGGAGGGAAPSGNGASEATTGGGGGGGVRVHPVGVLEVTGDDTRVLPVLDWTRIITTGITVFGMWMLVRSLFRRRR